MGRAVRSLVALLVCLSVAPAWAQNVAVDQGGGKVWDYFNRVFAAGLNCQYWRMDNPSGTTETTQGAYNHCGSTAVNLTYNGSPSFGQLALLTGEPNKSTHFTAASSQYATIPAPNTEAIPDVLSGRGWLLTAWIKVDSYTSPFSCVACDVATSGNASDGVMYYFNIQTDGRLDFCYNPGCGSVDVIGGSVGLGTRHMVALNTVGAGTNHLSSVTIYVDGVSVASSGATATNTVLVDKGWVIGRDNGLGTPRGYFDGTIDEVGIFTSGSAIPDQVVKDLWYAGSQSPHHGESVE